MVMAGISPTTYCRRMSMVLGMQFRGCLMPIITVLLQPCFPQQTRHDLPRNKGKQVSMDSNEIHQKINQEERRWPEKS